MVVSQSLGSAASTPAFLLCPCVSMSLMRTPFASCNAVGKVDYYVSEIWGGKVKSPVKANEFMFPKHSLTKLSYREYLTARESLSFIY